MKKIENNFVVTGFVGKDAEIRQFSTASVARFSPKGAMITVEGYFKPEEWQDNEGVKHNRVLLVANKFYETPEKEETPAPEEKKTTKKGK